MSIKGDDTNPDFNIYCPLAGNVKTINSNIVLYSAVKNLFLVLQLAALTRFQTVKTENT